ncbi:hypothetical protein [Stutzerimonas kirkiae]|uniref:hypothetical protein n=1 Tax=Stutzerimonas kirkiae TaxID=2211392 RepID=UPI0010383DA9|nr:hypothetical protein [Stutzerimonas kirkiae]TBV09529.1 hypothetical protein DNK08_08930 [Stutzerimonas kirkiae]
MEKELSAFGGTKGEALLYAMARELGLQKLSAASRLRLSQAAELDNGAMRATPASVIYFGKFCQRRIKP